jgi:hypothetical protein
MAIEIKIVGPKADKIMNTLTGKNVKSLVVDNRFIRVGDRIICNSPNVLLGSETPTYCLFEMDINGDLNFSEGDE